MKMPTGACASSVTTMEPMPRRLMRARASASGVDGRQASGAPRHRSPSRVSSDWADSVRDTSAACIACREASAKRGSRRSSTSANGALTAASACAGSRPITRQRVATCAV